jgi:3D (Asp-Asp-Asp) domain-containing protein
MKYRLVDEAKFTRFCLIIVVLILIIALIVTNYRVDKLLEVESATIELIGRLSNNQQVVIDSLGSIQERIDSVEKASAILNNQIQNVDKRVRSIEEKKNAPISFIPSRGGQARATMMFESEVTAYAADIHCTGKTDGITFSGKKAVEGITVAADLSRYPLGTKLKIEGFDNIFEVQDKGSAINGNDIDIFFNSHEAAENFGRQKLKVRIIS